MGNVPENDMITNIIKNLIILLVASFYLVGCVSQKEKALSMPPMHITLRVVGKNGEPVTNVAAKVTQVLELETKPFCISISTFGGGGRNCNDYKTVLVFKGELGDSGAKNITVSYKSYLSVVVALPCVPGTDIRPYLSRNISNDLFMKSRVVTIEEGDNSNNENRVHDYRCLDTARSLKSWDPFFR